VNANCANLPEDPAYLVVDVETTGMGGVENGSPHRVIEIGAVKIRRGEIVREFATYLNPCRPLPQFITELTGIRPESLINAPLANEIASVFESLLAGSVFVAHNAGFDASFMRREGLLPDNYPMLCTVKLGRRVVPGLKSYSLGNLAGDMGIIIKDRHRALGDAMATAEIMCKFLTRMEQGDIRGYEAIKKLETSKIATAKLMLS